MWIVSLWLISSTEKLIHQFHKYIAQLIHLSQFYNSSTSYMADLISCAMELNDDQVFHVAGGTDR